MYVIKDPVGGYSFANDAYRYLNSANSIIEYFEQGGSIFFLLANKADWMSVSRISNYFPWISTLITLSFGSFATLIAGSIYSAFMASLTVVMIYKIAKDLLPEGKKSFAVDAAILAAFFPSYIIFTSVMLKEATVIFLSYSLLYIFYKLVTEKKHLYFILFVAGLIALATLRVYGAGVVLFAVGVGYLIYMLRSSDPKEMIRSFIMLAIIAILVITFGKSLFRIDFILEILDIENIAELREKHYGDAASYFEIGDLTSPLGLLKAIPIGFMYMILSPFPWQWFMGSDMVEKALAPDMIIYYIILPSAFLGFYKVFKKRSLLGAVLLSYFFALSLPYSVFIGNFGTIYRLRTQLLPCIVILAVIGGTPLVRWIYKLIQISYLNITKIPPEKTILDE